MKGRDMSGVVVKIFGIVGLASGLCLAPVVDGAGQTGPSPDRGAVLSAAAEIMKAARYCAVITVDDSGRPQARAIDALPPENDLTVWFATNPRSRKVDQIRKDPRVTLYYFDPGAQAYVTILGRARLVQHPAEKQKRWKPGWEAFWPDRGESFLLVEVTPEKLEVVSPKHKIMNDPVTWAPVSIDLGGLRR